MYTGTGPATARVALSDFDGDGQLDVLFYVPSTGAWTVGLSKGPGTFTTTTGTWTKGLQIVAQQTVVP